MNWDERSFLGCASLYPDLLAARLLEGRGIPDKRPPDKKPRDKRLLKMPTPDKRPHGQKTTRTKGHQAGFSTEKC